MYCNCTKTKKGFSVNNYRIVETKDGICLECGYYALKTIPDFKSDTHVEKEPNKCTYVQGVTTWHGKTLTKVDNRPIKDRYSQDFLNEVKDYFLKESASAREVKEHFGLTDKTSRNMYLVLNIKKERINMVKKLYEKGLPINKIVQKTKLSHKSVYNIKRAINDRI